MNDATTITPEAALVLFIIVALIIAIRWSPEIKAWYQEKRRSRMRSKNAQEKALQQSVQEYERQRKQMVKM